MESKISIRTQDRIFVRLDGLTEPEGFKYLSSVNLHTFDPFGVEQMASYQILLGFNPLVILKDSLLSGEIIMIVLDMKCGKSGRSKNRSLLVTWPLLHVPEYKQLNPDSAIGKFV